MPYRIYTTTNRLINNTQYMEKSSNHKTKICDRPNHIPTALTSFRKRDRTP